TFFTCRTKGCPAIPAATFEASFAIFLAAAEGALRELLADPAYGVPLSSGPTLEEATEAEDAAQARLTHLSRLFADNPDDAELEARYEQAKRERDAARSTVDRIRGEARSYRDELTTLRERIVAVLVSEDPKERRHRLEATLAEIKAGAPSPVVPLIAAWNSASFDARRTLVAQSFQRIDVFDDRFEATFRIGVPEPVAWPFHYPTRRRRSDETIPRLESHGFGKLLPVGFGKISGPDSVSSSGIHRTLTPKKWAARPMANVRQACKSRDAHKERFGTERPLTAARTATTVKRGVSEWRIGRGLEERR
ncbi:MAG TPA: hypothetical protein VE289_00255, partial [Gaiellaceae bacterium]|nr:hypothetical protein [Gaiellaceae bacterium]